MKKTLIYNFLILIFMSSTAFSAEVKKNIALAKLLKGEVKVIEENGDIHVLKKNEWIRESAVIQTSSKSFVKLIFIDKSVMSIGPSSEVKIEQFSKSEPGVINVLKGKIRSQVTKNYLEMEKGKSKLFIKSKSAVMGIRGTDFLFSASDKTGHTTAVLFEGSVVFNKLSSSDIVDRAKLENIVSKGQKIMPGQFSVVTGTGRATIAAKLSSQQFNHLFKNINFQKTKSKKPKRILARKSAVPPGLSGAVVSGSGDGLKNGLRKIGSLDIDQKTHGPDVISNSKGYINGNDFKPVDGSIVHLESGTIIPIPSNAEFDKATSEWVSNSVGGVDQSGSYVAPEGYEITDEGRLIKKVVNQELQKENKVVEVLIEAKPLDQNESFDKLPTTIIDAKVLNDGPKPAAGSGPEPVVESTSDVLPIEKDRMPSSENLPVPPQPVGTTYKPQTYNAFPPRGSVGPNRGRSHKTPVRINIRQGN